MEFDNDMRKRRMVMTAKSRPDTSPPPTVKLNTESASDEDKKEVNKMVREFLNAFEADYRQKIKARDAD